MLLMLFLLILGLTVGAAALAYLQFTPPTETAFSAGEADPSDQAQPH
jgi:hypothetical protein